MHVLHPAPTAPHDARRGRSDRWPPREAAPHPPPRSTPIAPQGRGAGAPQTPLAALTLNPSAHPAHHTDSPHEFTIPPLGALWAQRVDADILGHSEDTLANITLVPPLSPSRRSVLALERLLDASVQLATVRLKLEAISPPPCDVHMFSGSPLSQAAGSQLGTPPHTCSEQLRQRVAHSVLLLVQLRHSLVELAESCRSFLKCVYALELG